MTIQTIDRTPSQIYFEREPESDPVAEKQSLRQHRIAALSLSRKLRGPERSKWEIFRSFGIHLEHFIGPLRKGENTPEFEQARAFLLKNDPTTFDELQQWEMVEIVAWKELQTLQQRINKSIELYEEAYEEIGIYAQKTMLSMTRDQVYSVNASFGQFYDDMKSQQQRQIQQRISARRWFKVRQVTKIGLEYTGYAFLVILSPIWFPIFLLYAYILKIHNDFKQ